MPDAILSDEREWLAACREALARMHATAADWRTAIAGDAVSTAYLKQTLYRRMAELEDSPDAPLFFGRVDFATALGAPRDETCHIGRRHVTTGPGGDPMVVDWRAPVSRAFYQARPADPMGVRMRRRFGFHKGELTAYEDEDVTTATSSALLEAEIERPRTGPMRDIVATIQPDQDDLVRAGIDNSLCIQGAPGTGKTAVGLHRAAWLLYTWRERLAKAGVLVIGPNDSFLAYIADVLPALGEIDATQETIESLVASATGLDARANEPVHVASLKGDARMAAVLMRAVWAHLGSPDETLVVPRGHRQWRVGAHLVRGAMEALRSRGVRYGAGRDLLPQSLAHRVLLRMEVAGEVTDDRLQDTVARSRPVKSMADALWPALTPARVLYRLYSDAVFLSGCAEGVLDDEQALLGWDRAPRTPGAARWTSADLVLLDELGDILARTPSLGHVIVDEAQDLSAMQLRAVGRRASTGSVTVLGDLAQATTPWASRAWADAMEHLGKPGAGVRELIEGFRVPGDVLDFAARLLPAIAPTLEPPRAVRRSRGSLVLIDSPEVWGDVAAAIVRASASEGTIGIVVPDADADRVAHLTDDRVSVVPASLAKGLEFDHVVVVEPSAIVAAEPDELTGLRRLYVCLTRAVTSLTVVHRGPLPAQLGIA